MTTFRDQLQASLGSTYTVQRELGGGGMSRVFLARDEGLGRDIVVKVLSPELSAGLSADRFTREIKLAAALQHPHVLPVLSAGIMNGLPYYTMPFVRGESLRASMGPGKLSRDDALAVITDVAKALRYAHGEGVIHRDIKPENVLMSSGSAVVVDFGIAKAISASKTAAPGGTLTTVGTSIGTPAYMSPEQAAADPAVDQRSDIYSWGVLAYELFAGKHPFEGRKTPQQLLAAHLAETPAQLGSASPDVPAPICALIMRCLEKNPDSRPQSAGELVTQLGAATSGNSGLAAAIPGAKSKPWRIPAIAALTVVIGGVAFGVWSARGTPRPAGLVTLAVLPFENQGPAEQEYFVDGLSDAVNGKLAGLAGVSVIDRRSTQQYKKTTKPVKQIGTELGVQYVLGGVVRWARNSAGGWRAQVIPTLVNASDATTKWAGDPLIVSSDDPFSAQTEIATKVANALQLALGADDRRELAERPTQNTEAYDAYLRGKSIRDALDRSSMSVRGIDQSISELQRAVSLDPNFAQAWALLAMVSYGRAETVPGDTVSMNRAYVAARRAESLNPRDPLVVEVRSGMAYATGDRARSRKITNDAIRSGIVNHEILLTHAWDLRDLNQGDSSRAVMERVLKLNPRFPRVIEAAAEMANQDRDWARVAEYARTLISIDPTDERGWATLANVGRNTGDSLAIRRVIDEAFRYIPAPSNMLLTFIVYAGGDMGLRFAGMTPEQLRIEALADSIGTYYDNKADLFGARGEPARARIYYDSIIGKLEGRSLSGPGESNLRIYLAHAYSATGRHADAARELARVKAVAMAAGEVNEDGTPEVDRRIVAGILANAGQSEAAVRELRVLLNESAWTRRGLAAVSKLRALRGTPSFEAFLKEKEQVTRAR